MKMETEYVQRTFRLHAGTVRLLDEYSSRTGVTRTFAVEKAITEYLEREGHGVVKTGKEGGGK